MRLRLEELELAGTERQLDLTAGLNVITGPITTGKTTTLRLIRMLLGASVHQLPAEVRSQVPGLRGRLLVGDDSVAIYRPLVSTATARVEISEHSGALRLPATSSDDLSTDTYGDWLLRKLQLPQLAVPSAPTRPDSDPTPVTFNDYMNYCVLTDNDIDSSVFGHLDPFRNIKRRYVFQILYGIYGIEAAALQERYRDLSAERTQLVRSSEALARMLRDTPWENRAQLYQELEEATSQVALATADEATQAREAAIPHTAQDLRGRVLDLDQQLEDTERDLNREEAAVADLRRLTSQLVTQSSRLTRAIVAETHLLDFEFIVCPRCGSTIDEARGNATLCRLCLQPPSRADDRQHLVEEQNRLGLQVAETRELIERHEDAADRLRTALTARSTERRELATELDRLTRSYVADSAALIAGIAAQRTRAEERALRLRDYASLFDRMDAASAEQAQLDEQLRAIEQELARHTTRGVEAEAKIQTLERNMRDILGRFDIPRFADPPTVEIDRNSFLPRVDGRSFDTASQGMKVLINVAHALAHQLTGIEERTSLPNILIIDALSSNLGHGGYDEAVRERVYGFLAETSEVHGESLQIIVADNDVPSVAEPFVRLELARDDMLVPA